MLGYAGWRTREAWRDLQQPAPPLRPDPAAYGRLRRGLMLADMARSLAELGAAAYGIGAALEPKNGEPEHPARRIALMAAALAGSALIDVPVNYVEGHVLERRYGLSKQTREAWLADQAKGFAVSAAIMLPLLEGLAALTARAPQRWPLVATAASVPLLVLANVVAPTFIAPLFNDFKPIEGEMESRIRELASRYGAGDATILRVDMSRQTEKANAYVTGVLDTRRIVVGDTLIDRFEERETLFVVAHELGHYVHKDVWRGVAVGTAAAGIVFFSANAIAGRRGRSLASAAGLARLLFASSLLGIATGPALASFSRSRERAADEFAIAATDDAEAGIAAFTRLRERNMAEEAQPRWMEVLFSSHPSLRSRIERMSRAAKVAVGT